MRLFLTRFLIVLTIFVVCNLVMSEPSFAAAGPKGSPVGHVLCTMAGWFSGNVGKGIAMIAVFIIGAGALLGKITWGMAAVIGVGIAIIFGGDILMIKMGFINCHATFV